MFAPSARWCRHWRNIALDTPRLWCDLKVSLLRDPKEVKVFWDRTPKAVPMSIYIVDITDEDVRWQAMEECRLDRFSHIATLDFVISHHKAVARFESPQFHPPTGRLDNLSVRYAGYDRDKIPDLSPLMGQLSPTISLSLIYVPILTLRADFVAPSVTKLTIKNTKAGPFDLLIQTFPNAEEVELEVVRFRRIPGGTVIWPKLLSLTVCDSHNIPWANLQTPRITNFSWWKVSPTNVVNFITAHQSIRHLDAQHQSGHTGTMLAAAPQLLTLCIDSGEEICNGSLQAMESLTSLTIYHAQILDLDQFERLVCSRFIPKSEQRENKNYPSLTILIDPDFEFYDMYWKTSEFLSSATLSVSTVKRWGTNWPSYCYDWNMYSP